MATLPAVRGVIDRRILVNYRVDPAALSAVLPDPFSPVTVDGYGVGGICLIRLTDARPRGLPAVCGLTSENAAHRIAVTWDDGAERGVYVPRRDSSSRLQTTVGGRLFAGDYEPASFAVEESADSYDVRMDSDDGTTHVGVTGTVVDALPEDSVFDDLAAASAFFQSGSLGYSGDPAGDTFDGIELATDEWSMRPLAVESVTSSFFEERFPDEAVAFDDALLMRDIDHEWRSRESLCATG